MFLISSLITVFVCSTLIIVRKYSDYAVAGLAAVVITQAIAYKIAFAPSFILRNLSVVGGLLMVLTDSWVRKSHVLAGLPSLEEKDHKIYFQLAGRTLLIFLFIGLLFGGEWRIWRAIVVLFGFVSCAMVIVGFKAKFSAIMLIIILSVFNILVNNFWALHADHPGKDYAQYNFFQTLYTVGGLLLLVSSGSDKYSYDEKTKHCSSTVTETRALGCEFDVMSYSWVPSDCRDRETDEEFRQWLRENDRRPGLWPLFEDKEMTMRIPDEYALFEWIGQYAWAPQEEHLGHCVFLARRLHWALTGKFRIDWRDEDVNYTIHCTHEFLRNIGAYRPEHIFRVKSQFGLASTVTLKELSLDTTIAHPEILPGILFVHCLSFKPKNGMALISIGPCHILYSPPLP
ncbi:hypothetical protein B7463_g2520, partial [Scytalidium lignicola]